MSVQILHFVSTDFIFQHVLWRSINIFKKYRQGRHFWPKFFCSLYVILNPNLTRTQRFCKIECIELILPKASKLVIWGGPEAFPLKWLILFGRFRKVVTRIATDYIRCKTYILVVKFRTQNGVFWIVKHR